MKKILTLSLLALLTPAFALALSLDAAKSQGLVGEKADGYLGEVVSNPEVKQLVQRINNERRANYQKIAKKNGTDLGVVEVLAGKKALEKTPRGQMVQGSGGWQRK